MRGMIDAYKAVRESRIRIEAGGNLKFSAL